MSPEQGTWKQTGWKAEVVTLRCGGTQKGCEIVMSRGSCRKMKDE